jgi:hypothetical protein
MFRVDVSKHSTKKKSVQMAWGNAPPTLTLGVGGGGLAGNRCSSASSVVSFCEIVLEKSCLINTVYRMNVMSSALLDGLQPTSRATVFLSCFAPAFLVVTFGE